MHRGLVLVTGANGQLGRALAALVPDGAMLGHEQLDVTDAAGVHRTLRRLRPDVVINAAAYTRVDDAESDPDTAERVNASGTRIVAEAASEVGALLVYPSSDYVFAGTARRPYREDDPPAPASAYGRTKLQGEAAALSATRHLIVRTSWVFGEGHNFIRAVLSRALSGQEPRVVSDQVGLPTYALDLAAAILRLVERGATGIWHVAGGGAPGSWADVADVALAAAGGATSGVGVHRVRTSEYESQRSTPGAPRPAYSVLDCSKAASAGVRLRPWPEAVREYVSSLELQAAANDGKRRA